MTRAGARPKKREENGLIRSLQKILEALRTASGGFEYRYDSTLRDWVPNQSSP